MSRLFFKNYANEEALELYGRDIFLKKIHSDIVSRDIPENIALLGVRGVGKTSIIKKAFGSRKAEAYFREKKIIVVHISLPETADSMKSFYSYLNNAILQGVDAIETYDKTFYDALMDEIVKEKNKLIARSFEIDDATVEAVLNKTIEIIQKKKLQLLLVFDDFEKFADASKVKRTQYKYMRDLANSGKGALFISTGKDLTKVSEEIKGSGFENIFRYEELRGLKELAIEDWIYDVLDEAEEEFDEEAIEWIVDISGGIPEIICYAGEVVHECMVKNFQFIEEECYQELSHRVKPLMKQWWEYVDEQERYILKTVHEGKSKNTVARNDLIKKGYLNQDDMDEVTFNTKLFEDYAVEVWEQEEIAEQESMSLNEIMQMLTNIQTRMDDSQSGLESFGKTFQDDVRSALANPSELFGTWNLTEEIWAKIPKSRQSNLVMAYTLIKFGFNEENKSLSGVDCRPVVVMLGNFLEGFLNDCLKTGLIKHLPNSTFLVDGKYVSAKDAKRNLTIGNYKAVWGALRKLALSKAGDKADISEEALKRFQTQLEECHAIRNHCDHPGEIVKYQDQKKYIQNLFDGNSSMVRILLKLQDLLK